MLISFIFDFLLLKIEYRLLDGIWIVHFSMDNGQHTFGFWPEPAAGHRMRGMELNILPFLYCLVLVLFN